MPTPIEQRQRGVTVRHFKDTIDEYGQKHTDYVDANSSMYLTKYRQTLTDDIRFNNVVWIGLTHDNEVDDTCNVLFDDKEYKVTHTIESSRWRQVFLETYEH